MPPIFANYLSLSFLITAMNNQTLLHGKSDEVAKKSNNIALLVVWIRTQLSLSSAYRYTNEQENTQEEATTTVKEEDWPKKQEGKQTGNISFSSHFILKNV